MARGLIAFLTQRRVVAAMLAAPAGFMIAMVELRSMAMTWGPLPVLTSEWRRRRRL